MMVPWARRPQCEVFARQNNLAIGTIADLIRYRLRNERSVDRIADQSVQTEFGEFRLCAYEDRGSHAVHLALVRGRLDGPDAPLRACACGRHLARCAGHVGERPKLDAATGTGTGSRRCPMA